MSLLHPLAKWLIGDLRHWTLDALFVQSEFVWCGTCHEDPQLCYRKGPHVIVSFKYH
jgi:hypothetical protein